MKVLQHCIMVIVQLSLFQSFLFCIEEQSIFVFVFFLREIVNEGEIDIEYCQNDVRLADIFTKTLGGHTFSRNVAALGIKSKFVLREALLE